METTGASRVHTSTLNCIFRSFVGKVFVPILYSEHTSNLLPREIKTLCVAGLPAVQSGVATIRRSNTVNTPRPAPPVRRNSSITGMCAAVASHRRAHGPIPENVVVTTQHRRTVSDVSCHFSISDDDHDECDDLPLPPPPAELMADLMCNNVNDTISSRPQIGHVSAAHANIINCLNQKFIAAKKPVPDSRNGDLSPASLPGSNDVTPTEIGPQGALLSQIHNGVKLRRAVTNDRSTPKLA